MSPPSGIQQISEACAILTSTPESLPDSFSDSSLANLSSASFEGEKIPSRRFEVVDDDAALRRVLAEANPRWVMKDIEAVIAKLSAVDITTLNDLAEKLLHDRRGPGVQLNRELKEKNYAQFGKETLMALCAKLQNSYTPAKRSTRGKSTILKRQFGSPGSKTLLPDPRSKHGKSVRSSSAVGADAIAFPRSLGTRTGRRSAGDVAIKAKLDDYGIHSCTTSAGSTSPPVSPESPVALVTPVMPLPGAASDSTLKAKIGSLQGANSKLQAKLTTLKSESTRQFVEKERVNQDLQLSLDVLKKELHVLRNVKDQATKGQRLNAQLGELQDTKKRLQVEVEKLNRELASANATMASDEAERRCLQTARLKVTNLEGRCFHLNTVSDSLKREVDTLQKTASESEDITAWTDAMRSLHARADDILRLESERLELRSQVVKLESAVAIARAESEAAKKQLEDALAWQEERQCESDSRVHDVSARFRGELQESNEQCRDLRCELDKLLLQHHGLVHSVAAGDEARASLEARALRAEAAATEATMARMEAERRADELSITVASLQSKNEEISAQVEAATAQSAMLEREVERCRILAIEAAALRKAAAQASADAADKAREEVAELHATCLKLASERNEVLEEVDGLEEQGIDLARQRDGLLRCLQNSEEQRMTLEATCSALEAEVKEALTRERMAYAVARVPRPRGGPLQASSGACSSFLCPLGHEMAIEDQRLASGLNTCDMCGASAVSSSRCSLCDYDLCQSCMKLARFAQALSGDADNAYGDTCFIEGAACDEDYPEEDSQSCIHEGEYFVEEEEENLRSPSCNGECEEWHTVAVQDGMAE